jgi:hypothetical protein
VFLVTFPLFSYMYITLTLLLSYRRSNGVVGLSLLPATKFG